jgi:hypothetical protein
MAIQGSPVQRPDHISFEKATHNDRRFSDNSQKPTVNGRSQKGSTRAYYLVYFALVILLRDIPPLKGKPRTELLRTHIPNGYPRKFQE